MNSEDTFTRINEIEKQIDISNFIIDDVNIWPIIRLHIGYTNDSYIPKKPAGKENELIKKALKKLCYFPLIFFTFLYNYIIDFKKNDTISKRDFLFITYGTSRRVKLEEGFFDVYLDPFIELTKKLGSSYVVLENNSSKYSIPRYNKSIFLSPVINFIQLYSGFLSRYKRPTKIKSIVKELNIKLKDSGLNIIDEKVLINKVLFINILSNYFEKILKKVKPKAVFTSNYYGIEFSLIAACKKLEIPTIDVQHGSQSSIHYAYGNWEYIPKNGFKLLPDIFWVWDKVYKYNKLTWIKKSKKHKVLIGGNPIVYLDNYKDKYLDNSKSKLYSLIGNRKHIVLFSLDSESIDIVKLYIKLIHELNNEKIFWGFRYHPSTSTNVKQHIKNMINPYINYDIDKFSKMSLFQVLGVTTIHITETSSVVLDALNYNIPSIVLHKDSKIIFKYQIENNIVYYIDNIRDIKNFIIEQTKVNNVNEVNKFTNISSRRFSINVLNLLNSF